MKKSLAIAIIALPLLAYGQRRLNYTPTDDGYIMSINGENRYTRALYGGNSLFRIETSDRPIFAAYHKRDNRNINFSIAVNGRSQRLDSVAECRSFYKGGERIYRLADPAWNGGTIEMTVLAPGDVEGGIWHIKSSGMPHGASLTARCQETVKVKINRSGDIGADPDDCFAPLPGSPALSSLTVDAGGDNESYILYLDRELSPADKPRFDAAMNETRQLQNRITISTPDPFVNTLGSTLSAAGDAIWDGTTWQHGAVGWRMPLSGWRGAYTGDFLGWHDRAVTHFDAYAASQVTDVEPVIPHPAQDSTLRLARAEKRWGTQMYSNGYICRNPGRNNQMHHYDMNLCYIDELMRHFAWRPDTAYARKMWPVIKAHLDWEKRNFDPDDDGLYDAYCCIWASDALYYSGGAVTHSSAYNYYANKQAAAIAAKIGEDPAPYIAEANKILAAMNSTLWMDNKGVWAEYKESLGHKRLHDHPALWTIYHAIDSETADPFQAYTATEYIDTAIPHIAVEAPGLEPGKYFTMSTTDWLPYAWSINNVAFAEVMHAALAYWQAGRNDAAFNLLKSSMLDGMFLGKSPGNIGQISHYDAARGECYRDFADPVGVMSRTVVEGLFGFSPDGLNENINVTPGFPRDWDRASITHPDFSLDYIRENPRHETYTLTAAIPEAKTVTFTLPALRSKTANITVNGVKASPLADYESVGTPKIRLTVPYEASLKVDIDWAGDEPSALLARHDGKSNGDFRLLRQDDIVWWHKAEASQAPNPVPEFGLAMLNTPGSRFTPINLSGVMNASVTDIFNNEYLSPRPASTTLQIPSNGLGEWCHPIDSAYIDDSGLRRAACGSGLFTTPQGIPFNLVAEGNNVAYTSLFDNYPDSVTIPLAGKADAIAMILAGSTNHMQCHMDNAVVKVAYRDGSESLMPLRAPNNWCPIEQDYFIDGKAFEVTTPRPLRITLKDAVVTDNLEKELGIKEVYGRRIDGGAGVILCMPIDSEKELASLTLTTLSCDVVAGIIAATAITSPQ